jgi:glutathionylspermidine synthase
MIDSGKPPSGQADRLAPLGSPIDSLLEELERDRPRYRRLAQALEEALRARGIFFGDGLLPTFVVPFAVDNRQLQRWHHDCEGVAARIEAVAREALDDAALFERLHLQPAARELLRIDPGYRRITTLSRPDAVVDGDWLRIVEFNSDSPAMMSFCDAVGECLLELGHLPRARFHLSNMTGALLETLLGCWHEFGGSGLPTIAITDWSGQKTRYEHQRIAAAFQAAGAPTVVCDPRAFSRREGRLEVDGRVVQLVYRRALFTELLARQSEVEPLLSAYRDGRICMVNSLRSYLASSKTLLAHLCAVDSAEQLARTEILTAPRIEELRRPPRRHVIKRGESHGGLHVLLPGLADESAWQEALDSARQEAWVVQDYCELPKLRLPDGEGRLSEKYFNWNPFLFDGRCAGSMARASDTPLINITLGGGLLPTFGYHADEV